MFELALTPACVATRGSTVQLVGVGAALLGFVFAVVSMEVRDVPHFDSTHKVMGLVVMCLAVCQVGAVVFSGTVLRRRRGG